MGTELGEEGRFFLPSFASLPINQSQSPITTTWLSFPGPAVLPSHPDPLLPIAGGGGWLLREIVEGNLDNLEAGGVAAEEGLRVDGVVGEEEGNGSIRKEGGSSTEMIRSEGVTQTLDLTRKQRKGGFSFYRSLIECAEW